MRKDILDSTLEDLEKDYWGEPEYGSHLVTECHRLRKIPLRDLSVEDLRIMLSQELGVTYLLPIAVTELESDPLAEGDFYPGDLCQSVLLLPYEVWKDHKDMYKRVKKVIEDLEEIPAELTDAVKTFNSMNV